jgi:hypothetical protein
VVLDVNKQVVYARNRRGSVIARQLVAVSDGDEVVTFNVYPLSTPLPLKRLFLDFDHRYADAVRLPLFLGPAAEDYTIAQVISQKWWDDGLWESGFAEKDAPEATRDMKLEQNRSEP